MLRGGGGKGGVDVTGMDGRGYMLTLGRATVRRLKNY